MPILEHLRELRSRLIISSIALLVCTIVCFIFYKFILGILYEPFTVLNTPETRQILFVNSIFEGFFTKIKISFFSGIILSFPLHLYNVVRFIFPGLEKDEKRIIVVSLSVSFVLILCSSYYSYFQIIPLSIRFLTNNTFVPKQIGMLLNYGQNIFYIFQFLFMALVLFQLPIVLELLLIKNVIQRATLLKASRYVIVIIFVLSAMLTPPDFVSQVSMALPLIVLYFLTLLIAKIFRFGEG